MDTKLTTDNPAGKSAPTGNRAPSTNRAPILVTQTLLRTKTSGQALLIIALSMILIIALVGLAVDGGSMYNERRTAQNGADGAAMAGTRQMLTFYESMVASTTADNNYWPSVAGAAQNETAVRDKINQYLTANGVTVNQSQAYFVDDNKNIVSAASGANGCGTGAGRTPCQVGQNGYIPWTPAQANGGPAASGIMVKGTAQTGTFFIRILGLNTASATANATAYMGVATSAAYDVNLFPVGFFTDTSMIDNLQIGQNYTLIAKDVVCDPNTGVCVTLGSGNWGWIDYNNTGTNTLNAWIDCGFNPNITEGTWPQWCPPDRNAHGWGPLLYWTGWPSNQVTGPYSSYSLLRFGAGADGWWIAGSTGTVSSACHNLARNAVGNRYIVPVFDVTTPNGGSNNLFHLYRLMKFRITVDDVKCNGNGSGHFNIQGIYENTFSPGSTGWHGDIRHNSLHLIFLAP